MKLLNLKNLKNLRNLSAIYLVLALVSNSYALGVYNQTGKEIKVKTTNCNSKYLINSKQECSLTTTSTTVTSNVGTVNARQSTSSNQYVHCSDHLTTEYLSINNILPNDSMEITDNLSNMPGQVCLQIMSNNTNDRPINATINKTCKLTVYETSSQGGISATYADGCFKFLNKDL